MGSMSEMFREMNGDRETTPKKRTSKSNAAAVKHEPSDITNTSESDTPDIQAAIAAMKPAKPVAAKSALGGMPVLEIDSPVYRYVQGECPLCKGMKHVFIKDRGWVRCECFKAEKVLSMMRSGTWPFPKTLAEITPEKLVMRSSVPKKLGTWAVKAHEPDSQFMTGGRAGILLLMNTPALSVLKEGMAALLSKAWLYQNADRLKTVAYARLSDAVTPYFTPSAQLESEGVFGSFASLVNADFLAFVFGDEATNNGHKTVLYEIMQSRMLEGRKTLAVSCMGISDIVSVYGRQTADMFKVYFDIQNF